MATIWITYAWADNKEGDVDFAAQELVKAGVDVKLDRWNIQAGIRLWKQIEDFIQNPAECDAWVLYATQNSLGSQSCKEEFAYALDRALNMRGGAFPVIGLFPSSADSDLVPAGIRTRLFVSITDPDWKERIKAAAEGRTPEIHRATLKPYLFKIHRLGTGFASKRYAIEVRPRAGTWCPFVAALPAHEKDVVAPGLTHGPKGLPPRGAIIMLGRKDYELKPPDVYHGVQRWWCLVGTNEATPTQSYYILCERLPSTLAFGVENETLHSVINISPE